MRLYLSSFRLGNKPEELLKLLAGHRKTGIIFNAVDGMSPEERTQSFKEEVARFDSLNLEISEIDLRKYFDDRDRLREDLSKFDLIWVRGGNTFVLARAFRQSGADKVIKVLLESDSIVYGGYSAGVCILSPTLKGIELCDNPKELPKGYKDEIVWEGMNILEYSVAPHYHSPGHPETELINKEVDYLIENKILFKALRDGEAIVRNGDEEFLVG